MFDLFWMVPLAAVSALIFALFLTVKVLRADEGTQRMKEIATAVREGAAAYLNRQYLVVSAFFFIVFLLLAFLSYRQYFSIFIPFAFLAGGFSSALAGFFGMKIATQASSRTANACRSSLNKGLRLAFASGSVMGFSVVGIALLNITIWYLGLNWYYTNNPLALGLSTKLDVITNVLLCLGMGASFMALFARVGGGIFTKAADVGADLVGKVEAGIPEDDPRNPATIADNVGDNVGDVAGMGADLYESYLGSIIATAVLGVSAGLGLNGVILPMILAALGIFASIVGTFFVRTKEEATQQSLLNALRKGIIITAALIVAAIFALIKFGLDREHFGISWAIITGLVAGILIGLITEYFTSSTYRPTQRLADSALTGPATIIISGISIGMLSTALPVLIISAFSKLISVDSVFKIPNFCT